MKPLFTIKIKNYPKKVALFYCLSNCTTLSKKRLSNSSTVVKFNPKVSGTTNTITLATTISSSTGDYLFEFTTRWKYDPALKRFAYILDSLMPKAPPTGFTNLNVVVTKENTLELLLTAK